jgi:hypothetical protein
MIVRVLRAEQARGEGQDRLAHVRSHSESAVPVLIDEGEAPRVRPLAPNFPWSCPNIDRFAEHDPDRIAWLNAIQELTPLLVPSAFGCLVTKQARRRIPTITPNGQDQAVEAVAPRGP